MDVTKSKFGLLYEVSLPDLIQKFIFYFGVWEPTISHYISRALSEGHTFIDVGANIGYFSCLASRRVGESGRVYAVEASPTLFAALEQNIRRNRLSNVTAINMAVYDAPCSLTIFRAGDDNLGASTVLREAGEKSALSAEAEIQADTLESIVGSANFFSARIIKIDIEGAEWFAFNGFKDQLEKFGNHTEWIIEFTPESIKQQGGDISEIVALFAQCGYSAYHIENRYSAGWYMKSDIGNYLSPLPDSLGDVRDVLFIKNAILIDELITK